MLATRNPGKIRELTALLSSMPIDLLSLADFSSTVEVEETGGSYLENARLKAVAAVRALSLPALAEDAGLEVAALGGLPGIHSARFAGPGATGEELIGELLRRLGPRAEESPPALFLCAAVIMLPDQRSFEAEGILEGTIAAEPRGSGGFGYDPVFVLADGRRLAELSTKEKNLLSHRARALALLEVRGAFDALLRWS